MNTLEKIMYKGLIQAKEAGLTELPELVDIPHADEIVDDFFTRMMDDLFDFSTMEQYDNRKVMEKAFIYSFGKGAEFAYSYRVEQKIRRIGYDFDECMSASLTPNLPKEVVSILEDYVSVMIKMYNQMYDESRVGQEQLHNEGIKYENCVYRILNGAFYWGKRIAQSLEIELQANVDFSKNNHDKKYDYDNYDKKYSELAF